MTVAKLAWLARQIRTLRRQAKSIVGNARKAHADDIRFFRHQYSQLREKLTGYKRGLKK